MPAKTVPCPKCGRQLTASGVVSIEDGPELPVYQCDECLVTRNAFGTLMEVALTFCVDENGRAFDPAAPDDPLFTGN
ncbi:MAG: hypothetical protein L0241_21090 [Planctomycetia bacterium]|nr:hypothetical protein [Planctomycetia bacterium]